MKGFKPLAYLQNKIYFYKRGRLYLLDDNGLKEVTRLFQTGWKDSTRFFVRLFRREPKYAVPLEDNKLLIVYKRKLFLFEPVKKTLTCIANARDGFSDPLNICVTSGKWLAVWGDYGQNKEHAPIYIYGLKKDLTVETIAAFEAGKIRHIHNIIHRRSGGYYIFTGDQEENAGIYQCDSDFRLIKPVKTGKQMYRAVVGFDTDKGLLYATDAVNEQNYIYLLEDGKKPQVITKLNGSCIYGCKIRNNYLFSTTVEPDENNRGITSWISSKRGEGILSDEVHLVCVDENLKSSVVTKFEKDFFPMKLMQYGSIQFLHGDGQDMWIYPVAVKRADGRARKVSYSTILGGRKSL